MVLLAISCYLLLGVAENLVASVLYFWDYQLALVILHGGLSCVLLLHKHNLKS